MERERLLLQFRDSDPTLSEIYRAQRDVLLRRYLPSRPIETITSEELDRFFRLAGGRWSLSYLRKVFGAASAFFSWALEQHRVQRNPMTGLLRAIDYSPGRQPKHQPPIYLEFATYLRNQHRSEDTIVQRIGDIRRFSGESDPLEATAEQLGYYLFSHRRTWSAEYRRKIRASFVTFFRWAAATGRIQSDPTLNLASVRPGKSPRSPIPDDDLLAGFYEAPLDTQAVIALAASLGLRRSEIAVLHTRDRSGRKLAVHGKNGKTRIVPLNDLALNLLLELEGQQGSGYYFRNQRTGHHLHPSTVYKRAKKYIGEWCLHSLRHRTATVGLRRGANIRGLQELLGRVD